MFKHCVIYFLIFLTYQLGFMQNWQQVGLGGGCGGVGVRNLFADTLHNKLIASGNFRAANGIDTIFGIAQWDGIKWDSLGSGIIGTSYGVEAIELYNGEIIVGGDFLEAGGVPARGLARWNGISWDSLGLGITSSVFDLLTYNDILYASGAISYDGGMIYSTITKWDGINWGIVGIPPPVGGGFFLRSLEEYNNEIYVGGDIENDSSDHILKWDGNNWRAVGQGLPDAGFDGPPVRDIKVYQNKLFIGGYFNSPSNTYNYPGIVSWDDQSYSVPGGGVDGKIYDMEVFNDTLYAVGTFSIAGGIPANCIAKWDGTNWCSLGSTFDWFVTTIEVFNNELYIGGGFTQIDGLPINHVAKWIGGSYTESCGNTTGMELYENEGQITMYPNPVADNINISKPCIPNKGIDYQIYNTHGQVLLSGNLGDGNLIINVQELPTGIYIIKYKMVDHFENYKFIKQ